MEMANQRINHRVLPLNIREPVSDSWANWMLLNAFSSCFFESTQPLSNRYMNFGNGLFFKWVKIAAGQPHGATLQPVPLDYIIILQHRLL